MTDERTAQSLTADAPRCTSSSPARDVIRALTGREVLQPGVQFVLARFYLRWLTPLALAVGVALRTREWLHDKSLWLDEYLIAPDVVDRSYAGLLQPLDNAQGGPIGWLWAEHASVELFGVHELALRLIPWLASVIAMPVFATVARALLGRVCAPAATVLFATAPILIYYAAETKQYASDVTCALLVLLVTIGLTKRTPTLRRSLLWGSSCGLLIWCSQPSILVAGCCGLFLAARWLRIRAALLPLLAGGAVLVVAVAADWAITLRQLSRNTSLQVYWTAGYPPANASVGSHLGWLRLTTNSLVVQVAHLAHPGLVLLLAAWGIYLMIRRRPWSALLLSMLPLVAVGAAVSRQYPLAGRLALYLLPVGFMLLTAGLTDPAEIHWPDRSKIWRRTAVVVPAFVFIVCTVGSIGTGLTKFGAPDDTTSGREAIEFVARHQQPGDVVLQDDGSWTALSFYGPKNHVTVNGTVSFVTPGLASCSADPSAVLGDARVWLVLAHHPSNEPSNRTQIYESQLAQRSTEIASYTGIGGAGAYLFDFARPPTSSPPVLASWVKNGCFRISR